MSAALVAELTYTGRSYRTARVFGCWPDETAVVDAALAVAGLTRANLWGLRITKRTEEYVDVDLLTD